MALRGPIRDILSIYLGYKVIAMWAFKAEMTTNTGIAAILLLLLSIWFVCERVGILPKL
ncbi:MAG: hypothetical protein KAT91_00385 [Candidatus Aenigmarchaeota archaeon]|nr:hypothetical protein [Candidatus Aenigmarchaeota archaeon]